eukprot:4009722-Alexandrium_andersonii.AAC.1
MSASLVGSEMCIRDSTGMMPRRARFVRVLAPDVERANLVFAVCSGSGTVSYTHLTLPTICSV